MQYSKCLDIIENNIGYRPSQAELCKILNVTAAAMSNRFKRDSSFPQEEIELLEKYYTLEITDNKILDCVELEYIKISPSCGSGTMVLDNAEVTPVKIGREIIKNLWNTKPEVLKLFKASGDSMEETITDGNILLVDISRIDYHNGGIYILQINNDWYCKRLRLRMTGELDIISDNSKYPIETLKPDTNIEVKVIGRVIKNLSKGL